MKYKKKATKSQKHHPSTDGHKKNTKALVTFWCLCVSYYNTLTHAKSQSRQEKNTINSK